MRISDWSSDVCSSDLRVAFVDVHQRVVLLRQRGDLVERGDEAVHREHAVGGDHDRAGAIRARLLQLLFQVRHVAVGVAVAPGLRSEEHTSELQSLMRISYAVFCLKKKTTQIRNLNMAQYRNV